MSLSIKLKCFTLYIPSNICHNKYDQCFEVSTLLANAMSWELSLQASTLKNGQTQSKNLLGNSQRIVWSCLDILCGWRLKGLKPWG